MKGSDEQIESFLKSFELACSTMSLKNLWPLRGGQIYPYFEIEEGLDMYHTLTKLKEKLSLKEIADLLPAPDIIKGVFLPGSAITSLKFAKKLGIEKISTEDIVNYALSLFEILKQKMKSDIFCLDGKNLLLDEREVDEIISTTDWNKPSTDEQKQISHLIVSANHLCYSLFYDIFVAGGFYNHGPYDASKKFGKDTILFIREYHDTNPKDVWPQLNIPYKTLRILGIYKNLDIKLDYYNHPTSKVSVGDKLIAYKIYLDNKEIRANEIGGLIDLFNKTSAQQHKFVNSLSDLDKVRKGTEIEYYLFRKLRKYLKRDWRPPKEVEQNIQKFGTKFI